MFTKNLDLFCLFLLKEKRKDKVKIYIKYTNRLSYINISKSIDF